MQDVCLLFSNDHKAKIIQDSTDYKIIDDYKYEQKEIDLESNQIFNEAYEINKNDNPLQLYNETRRKDLHPHLYRLIFPNITPIPSYYSIKIKIITKALILTQEIYCKKLIENHGDFNKISLYSHCINIAPNTYNEYYKIENDLREYNRLRDLTNMYLRSDQTPYFNFRRRYINIFSVRKNTMLMLTLDRLSLDFESLSLIQTNYPNLRSLNMINNGIKLSTYNPIVMPNLKSVIFKDNTLYMLKYVPIQGNLYNLNISNNNNHLSAPRPFFNILSGDCSHSDFNDNMMGCFRDSPSLTSLNLNYNNITHRGLMELRISNLTHLSTLTLNNNNIDNRGALVLFNGDMFNSLTYLEMKNNNINRKGVKYLCRRGLINLRHISVLNSNISPHFLLDRIDTTTKRMIRVLYKLIIHFILSKI